MTLCICPECGMYLRFDLTIGVQSLRYEMPCSRCGAVFRLGDRPGHSPIVGDRLRYFNIWRNHHDRLPRAAA